MGFQDRSYSTPKAQASRFADAPVVKWLLIINISVFLLEYATDPPGNARNSPLYDFGHLSIASLQQFQLWRLITFQFLHGDVFHLFFNMFGLFMFGPIVERWWDSQRFAWFYGLCGVAGGLAYVAIYTGTGLFSDYSPFSSLVGASAGIFGIFVAVAVIAPNMRIQLIFPPIPMAMRTFAIIILGFGVFQVLTRGDNAGGEAGHLGGALIGFLLMKFPHLVPGGASRPGNLRKKKSYKPKLKPRAQKKMPTAAAARVDEILDKINKQGFQSLTDEEREILNKSAKEE